MQTSIEEGTDENSEQRAKELLVKLAEYKPLAKIEEMEEQNYNMIDNEARAPQGPISQKIPPVPSTPSNTPLPTTGNAS